MNVNRPEVRETFKVFSDGQLILKIANTPTDFSTAEIETDAKQLAKILSENTSSCFLRNLKAELDRLNVLPPIVFSAKGSEQ